MQFVSVHSSKMQSLLRLAIATGIAVSAASTGYAQYDGLLQPYRQVELASDESGIIAELVAEEGQWLRAGDSVARLSSDIEQVQFELARHIAESRGNYNAAEKTLEKRKAVLDEVRKMHETRHANENELMRADLEFELAVARMVAARDELIAQQYDMENARIRLERRTIKSPIDGFVSRLHRQAGEYVSPVHSDIATIVDVSRLYAVFNVPSQDAEKFRSGNSFDIQCSSGPTVKGTVEKVGVAIDAQSGTLEVKLLVENFDHRLLAGDTCVLLQADP